MKYCQFIMKDTKFVIIFMLLAFFSCKNGKKASEAAEAVVVDTVIETVRSLPPLEEGEVFLKDKDPFGEVIELKGENIVPDTTIFKINGTQTIIKDNRMIMYNPGKEYVFMLWEYPGLKLKKLTGKKGNGPNEFTFATLVNTPDTSLLCYVYDAKTDMYKMDKEGNLTPYPTLFPKSSAKNGFFFLENIVNVSPDNFLYVAQTPKGKGVLQVQRIHDSIQTKEICNLAFDPKYKSPFRYTGDFAVNPARTRMVYAYKYFKIIKFMDIEGKTVRTLNFAQKGFDDESLRMADGLDSNVTHYWGICPQEDFVYCIYSGRTPYQVTKEGRKKIYYMYIEQYDWNGNPVKKYKVDRWGYFTVDEARHKLYIMSVWDDDPFFVFQLPE